MSEPDVCPDHGPFTGEFCAFFIVDEGYEPIGPCGYGWDLTYREQVLWRSRAEEAERLWNEVRRELESEIRHGDRVVASLQADRDELECQLKEAQQQRDALARWITSHDVICPLDDKGDTLLTEILALNMARYPHARG